MPTENSKTHPGSLDVIFLEWSLLSCSGPMQRSSLHLEMPSYGHYTYFLAMSQSTAGVNQRATYVSMLHTSKW